MRETLSFEVRLRRFTLWRAAVAVLALAAIAAVSGWAWSTGSARDADGAAWASAIAIALALATVVVARSLARVVAGVLAFRDGCWTFVTDSGRTVAGPLTVALDWGAFVLLRIDGGARARLWLPVQRRGLEGDWHALRCALYAPPRAERAPARLAEAPSE